MTPHLAAVSNTEAPSNEMLDLALMVAESSWHAKEYVAAKRAAQLALQIDPNNPVALMRLGRIALIERDFETASRYFARGPRTAAAMVNLAIASGAAKYFDLAIFWCNQAIQKQPDFLPAHIHLAAILEETGDLKRAEAVALAALELFPGNPDLLYMLSLYQLKRGDFEQGWTNYEQRPPRLDLARKLDEYPEWQGEDLEGKTILVCGEQGLGDQIMFARYLPLLEELGARVVLFTMPELARLFASSFPTVRILASDAELKGLEPDYWAALCSLPLRWRQFEAVDQVEMPRAGSLNLPYLWPERADGKRFADLLPRSGRLKVGLCWKGNPQHRRDEYRSMRFEDLKPILELSGIDFYSLHRGDSESGLVNLTEYCHDIADTAAAIANLDLVITVDTAMLHLAGAIGKPVWGLIYTPGDWRWGVSEKSKTEWYRSARLIRQQKQRDWKLEVDAIAFDLRALVAPVDIGALSADTVRETSARYLPADAPTLPIDRRCGWRFPRYEHIKETDTVTSDCRYGMMTWLRNDHYIGRALDLYGEYSESEAELLKRLLEPGDTVVEAGANVGGLTRPIAEAVGKHGAVHAFEPQPAYFECLRTNADRASIWSASIVPYYAALGSSKGLLTLRRVEEEKIHAPGWESKGSYFNVDLTTIDALKLDACHLIKIDVDGPEHDILLGAERTIDRCRPLIYVEHDKPQEYPELLAWLVAKGYRLYRHAAPLFNPANYRENAVNVFGSLISLMVLAVPNERKDLHPCDWGLERIQVEKE